MMVRRYRQYLKGWIAYFTLSCMLMTSQPCRGYAEECYPEGNCSGIFIDEDDANRARNAKIVVGATLIALVGGVAYLAFGGGSSHKHKKHSHSHSRSSSCSHDSYYSHSSHHSHHHHHHRSHYYSDYSDYYSSNFYSPFYESLADGIDYHSKSDPQFFERTAEGNLPARCRRLPRLKKVKEAEEITGVFVAHPSLSESSKGHITAFVQLPDGTTQILGTLSFSASNGSSLSYGPFTQKGHYLFGVRVDGVTGVSSSMKVGSVEVNVNGSTVESHDFFVPAHVPSHYEPAPCRYSL